MNRHNIVLVESFVTVGTFPHTIGKSIIDTTPAEDMPTAAYNGVFEVLFAN